MDFVIGLLVFTNWKSDIYNSILVIIDWLTKIILYELVKIIIDTSDLNEVILNVIVQYHDLPN